MNNLKSKIYYLKDFSNLNQINKKFKKISFVKCKIYKSNFWESFFEKVKFENCLILKSIFCDANLMNAEFTNCTIKNSNFSHSNLRGAKFSKCEFIDVNLRDAVYDNYTKWPKKFNSEKFGTIKNDAFDPYDYKIKMSYKAVKNLPLSYIKKYKKKPISKNKLNIRVKKIIKELTTGKGYIILNNLYSKKEIDKAEKIINNRLKNNKKFKYIKNKFEIDKREKSINYLDIINTNQIFADMIQPKIIMNAFKKLMGEDFICTYFAAQCSLSGARGQSLHLDYPYVSFNKPGQKIPIGMGSKDFLLSCGILTYVNEYNPKNSGPIILEHSHKLRRFPNVEDVKKNNFKQVFVPKGGVLVLNTLMWHAALPNYTDNLDRSILVAHYTPEFVKRRSDFNKLVNKNILKKDKLKKGYLNQLLK